MPKNPGMWGLAAAAVLLALTGPARVAAGNAPTTRPLDTFWIIPHTHWEGAVFKTREEYLQVGMRNILHALQLLRQYPHYTFVLDQVAYVKPFLERYPEQEALFRKFIAEGRLQLVLGMDVMPDDSKPGGEVFIRQIQYGKGYYRRKLGVDVTCAWLLDTFGHHPQLPQLLKLGGYHSFWFFRGVPRQNFPSEFIWQGIDGTRIPAFWLPQGYGLFHGSPAKADAFEKFARRRFAALNPNARGHDRVALAGADVSDPEDQLPVMMREARRRGGLPFNLRFGTPSQFEAVVKKRTNLPVYEGALGPIFQGTYSSRIELKEIMRDAERRLVTAEKLSVLAGWLGAPVDRAAIWQAWEPVLFNETHDLASGVMTDHVYQDTLRGYDFSKRMAQHSIARSQAAIAAAIDTSGPGAPIIVFNVLGWDRTDVAQADVGFTKPGVRGIELRDSAGGVLPVQIVDSVAGADGGIREARIAFLARGVPAMGYAVYHAAPLASPVTPAVVPEKSTAPVLENQFYRITFNPLGGAITSIHVKDGDWEALAGPANVVARQDDHGDLWELYHGLDGGSRIAMTDRQAVPTRSTARLSNDYHSRPGVVRNGPVFSEFSVSHPFDGGTFATTVRLAAGSRRIGITTRLLNNTKFVRYQALFPTAIRHGRSFQSIPLGAIERPAGIEFPAQDWVDYGDDRHGLALLNVGLHGNLVTDDVMMLSLLRSHTLGGYGYGGGYEPGMSSDTGLELGRERTLHYAMEPHRGDWRVAGIFRAGLELNNPLLCYKAAPHAGTLPRRWGWLSVSNPAVVVSALSPGRDGAAVLRVYEATGRSAPGVKVTFAAPVESAREVNFMEDPIGDVKPSGRIIQFSLSPFQIKTFSLHVRLNGQNGSAAN